MTDYEQFIHDKGYKYQNEDDLKAAYDRSWKSSHGIIITEDEFIAEVSPRDDERKQIAKETYAALVDLAVNKGIIKPQTVYQYARHHWCLNDAASVIAYQTGSNEWTVNNCDTEISEEQAVIKINQEWGFEASRVKIIGTPYYDATDWMFIRFNCAYVSWLWAGGELYQIYN